MDKLRSLAFNILFYGVWTPLVCTAGLPFLLFGRKGALGVSRFYTDGVHVLEKYVLGLDYEIRGIEHRPPANTPYLVAAKHQSAYETVKLFRLFRDPTIILKRELLWLPLFGWYLRGLDVIAIDRGRREQATASLYAGAKKMRDQNRAIIIFPQGTRVKPDATVKEKPYKGGIIKLYNELGLPILPVAMNSGLYWPRNGFWKKPGKVIFEFLPLIPPGLQGPDVMKALEEQIETTSKALVEEGRGQV